MHDFELPNDALVFHRPNGVLVSAVGRPLTCVIGGIIRYQPTSASAAARRRFMPVSYQTATRPTNGRSIAAGRTRLRGSSDIVKAAAGALCLGFGGLIGWFVKKRLNERDKLKQETRQLCDAARNFFAAWLNEIHDALRPQSSPEDAYRVLHEFHERYHYQNYVENLKDIATDLPDVEELLVCNARFRFGRFGRERVSVRVFARMGRRYRRQRTLSRGISSCEGHTSEAGRPRI